MNPNQNKRVVSASSDSEEGLKILFEFASTGYFRLAFFFISDKDS